MKKIKNITLGGIQQKVFNLVLIMILLMMAAYTVVIIYQANRLTGIISEASAAQKESITSISQGTMGAVLDANLTQNTRMLAYMAGTLFDDAAGVVNTIADYAEKLFADPASYPRREVPLPDRAKDGEISVQLLTEEGVDISDPAIAEELGLIGNLADLMTAVYAEANVDSCYAALPNGVMLLVDDHAGSKFDDSGNIVHIPIRERLWYIGAEETGGLHFTDVTTDLFTGQISIMCSLPVYRDGQLVAVIGADLFLNDMAETVNRLSQNGGFVCIVNQNGHVVFSPQTEGVFRVQSDDAMQDLRSADSAELAAFIRDALAESTGLRLIEADGESYYMAGAPIENVGWTVLNIVPKSLADMPTAALVEQYDAVQSEALDSFSQEISHARSTIIVLIAVVVLLSFASALILAKRIVKPLESITKRVRSLGGDDLQFTMEKEYRTGDEIEVLAESFAMLSAKTLQYISEVERVTAEKERIGAELSLATRIQADIPRVHGTQRVRHFCQHGPGQGGGRRLLRLLPGGRRSPVHGHGGRIGQGRARRAVYDGFQDHPCEQRHAGQIPGADPHRYQRRHLREQPGGDVRHGLARHSGALHREADRRQRRARISRDPEAGRLL